ncbi:hypothetical protein H5S40_07945 [Limosilactobacillus sp. RRLNB_1_1]|uniref:Lipoprotein n=1 Tax=Limosilactobacillus albertensis TaxID=2759752 RepID=A0A7W3TT08_9LACO|nr:hypothetical protein [Limosilactobacillus albertensis]MBB1070081.1 hypothetical protein [Limosilactobacillus albertensis]MCD7117318.1 hypothetical protein [Limosilactobacillus albertensis]MCD7128922.1 hypothetical protein [Limosilactobacillus albertensis]
MKKLLAITAVVASALSLVACGNSTNSTSKENNSVSSSKKVVKHHQKEASSSSTSSSLAESSVAASDEHLNGASATVQDNAQSNSLNDSSVNAESTSVDAQGNTHHITMSGQVADGYQMGTDVVTTPDGQSRIYEYTKNIDN